MNKLVLALAAILLPGVASAQSSWDVSIVSATGAMQIVQGATYNLPAKPHPFNPATLFGVDVSGGIVFGRNHRITVAVHNSRSCTVILERDNGIRYEPIATAALKNPAGGTSFSGAVLASDGGAVTIAVSGN